MDEKILKKKKIGWIGGGNMAYAMVAGILQVNPGIRKNLMVSDPNEEKREKFEIDFKVKATENNKAVIEHADILILAVKPHKCEEVLHEIRAMEKDHLLVVSIAAGVSLKYLQEPLGPKAKIVRTMPNTPVLVQQGMTLITPNANVEPRDLNEVRAIFESIGKVDEIEEKFLDAVAAISASGPAYVYMFIEALGDGGVLKGLPRKQSYEIAAQAVLGAAKMILETEKHPGDLKDMVCSPGGMTIEAVYALERNHFRASIIEAVEICTEKSKKLVED